MTIMQNLHRFFFDTAPKYKWLNVAAFAAIVCCLILFKFNYHELWKDEWQAWHVARDMSWIQMLAFLFYEGHPSLWYIYLKIITLITPSGSDLMALQISHTLLYCIGMALLFFRFRFSIWLRVLIALGFFCFFEYGTVNRGYMLVIVLAFWVATLLDNIEGNIWKIALGLLLLCQAEAQGVIIASGLWFYAFAKNVQSIDFKSSIKNQELQLLLAALFFGILIFIGTVYPRAENEDLARAYNMLKQPLSESIPLAFQGLLANTFWIGSIEDTAAFGISTAGIIISIILLFSIFYLFLNQKYILITMGITMLAFYVFAAFVFGGGVRQWGMLLVFFYLMLHFYANQTTTLHWSRGAIIVSIVGFSFYYNILAVQKEIQFPFSNAKATATFLATNVPEKVPIVAINPFENGAVVGYLGNQRKVYKMPEGEPFTWFKWLSKTYIPSENELKLFAQFKGVGGIIVLSPQQLPSTRFPNVKLWKTFDTYSIKGEKFYIYTLAK